MLDPQSALSRFSGLTLIQKMEFLAQLSHKLTVLAREWYLPDSVDISKAKTYNEILHKILGILQHMIAENSNQYSEEDFITSIFLAAEEAGISREFAFAWKLVLKQFS